MPRHFRRPKALKMKRFGNRVCEPRADFWPGGPI